MFNFHLNLALLIVGFLLVALYYFIRLYFSYQYRNAVTLRIESANDVISNRDLEEVVNKIQHLFGLDNWNVNYGDLKFSNFGRGINFHKKEINIARLPMNSVGYELDYVISRIWYVKEIKEKHYGVRLFSFISNWWMKLIPYLCILLLLLQAIIFFYGLGFDKGMHIDNAGMKWLFDYPLIFILLFIFLLSIFTGFLALRIMKENLEERYTNDTLNFFREVQTNYYFDFKSARTYSQRVSLGYNFAFNNKGIERLEHWLGPFLNY